MKNIPLFITVIAALVLTLFIVRECGRPPIAKVPPKIVTDTVFHVDTVPVPGKIVYYPAPYETIDCVFVENVIDTAAFRVQIMADYFRLYKYTLPVLTPPRGELNLLASVRRNKIEKYEIVGSIFDTTYTITNNITITPPNRRKVYLGALIGSDLKGLSIMPLGVYQTRRDHLYFAGYNIPRKEYSVGMAFKIRLGSRD